MEETYRRLAAVLDALPNGFPSTESGVEIELLKRIFTPPQAEMFCRMRLSFETAEQVASRTGRPLEEIKPLLYSMARAGQLFCLKLGRERYFKMLPWVFGIYEMQLGRMDREFAELCERYRAAFSRQFFSVMPALMQVLPVEEEMEEREAPLPYERISTLLEAGQSFLINECICKKERSLLGRPCDRPLEVCLAVAPLPGVFDNSPQGRVCSRQEAYALMRKAEEAGLVHLTSNLQHGAFYICNCCKCCCGVLTAINELGVPAQKAVNAHYYARIDAEACLGCGLCAEKRCQVAAIAEQDGTYKVSLERCIGCGLCVGTCPAQAISLHHKGPKDRSVPPLTEEAWFEERGRNRGVDFQRYK